ncbi:hypothetical protein MKK69_23205 [Methylobacterium sp. J-026]|uniref:hypothetical protein n=1 Tax=Methylobacterium sp. J-026 TaxID=2836624 RepID=UPI001FB8E738|nr:hypothetical protein [Methylobacterium sp. J-026]MCJ2136922.1 hypothetical protein [Methylobacterium sp. J-026]
MTTRVSKKWRSLHACACAWLTILSGCGGALMPGIQVGLDEGGSTFGFDSLPFEIRREDGLLLKGHASVRLLRITFYTQDAKRLVACSGGFTLDSAHAPVSLSVDCTGTTIMPGTVTTARADRGEGTFSEPNGRIATFRYGALLAEGPSEKSG